MKTWRLSFIYREPNCQTSMYNWFSQPSPASLLADKHLSFINIKLSKMCILLILLKFWYESTVSCIQMLPFSQWCRFSDEGVSLLDGFSFRSRSTLIIIENLESISYLWIKMPLCSSSYFFSLFFIFLNLLFYGEKILNT